MHDLSSMVCILYSVHFCIQFMLLKFVLIMLSLFNQDRNAPLETWYTKCVNSYMHILIIMYHLNFVID